jgi:hypothetical protein
MKYEATKKNKQPSQREKKGNGNYFYVSNGIDPFQEINTLFFCFRHDIFLIKQGF